MTLLARVPILVRFHLTLIFYLGETYSSYMPPEPTSGYPGASSTSQLMTSPSLQHAQDIMAFSERVIMPPMPAPAMPSHSPTALSPGSKRRDVSPARPSTRDGIMSQRSTTPVDSVPQKRSGKLPASGEFFLLLLRYLRIKVPLADFPFVNSDYNLKELVASPHTASISDRVSPFYIPLFIITATDMLSNYREEKRALCSDTGLTMNQVSNWFINAYVSRSTLRTQAIADL